jgi:hypothetical protein
MSGNALGSHPTRREPAGGSPREARDRRKLVLVHAPPQREAPEERAGIPESFRRPGQLAQALDPRQVPVVKSALKMAPRPHSTWECWSKLRRTISR